MAELAALGASAALAAMIFASRLPPGADFLLPRRGGFALYRAAWALFARPGGRAAFSAAAALLLLACAAALAVCLRRAARKLPASWNGRAGLALGPLLASILALRLVGRVLDLVQLVWFPYGAMDARVAPAAFALLAAALLPAAAAARDWAAGRRRRATILLIGLAGLDAAAGVAGAFLGVGRPLTPPAARGKTVYVVLTETEKGPGRDLYVLAPDVFRDADAAPYYREVLSGPAPDARTLPALRALYEEETKRWNPAGLRAALLLGAAKRDALAPSLLLAHLAAAPPAPAALSALGALADGGAWRIGPLGAAAIARAYAHLGDRAAAERWAGRAAGPRGVAPGLLRLQAGGALAPGRISGTVRAPGRVRAALYLKSDPAAPYLLDAAGLVAAAEPDARGRFSFSGLAAGRYYLAFALSAGDGLRGEISASGSRGDLILDAGRPALDLPPLTIKLTPR
jgi:hypothetical protein